MHQNHRFQFTAMTVPCEISVLGGPRKTAEALAKAIHHSAKTLEKTYNFYATGSWLSQKVNQRILSRVLLTPEQLNIFKRMRHLCEQTQGLFDPTIGTIKQAAHLSPNASREQLLNELQPAMGLNAWSLEGDYLVFTDDRTAFDLGGVMKEHAVDIAASLATQAGANCLINYGGDMHVKGRKANGDYVTIGIKDPLATDKILCSLAIENAGLTTSGYYERTLTIGGKEGAHIINNQPLANHSISPQQRPIHDILSATVIAPTTLEAGVFSTALMLNPTLHVPDHIQYLAIGPDKKIYSNLPSTPHTVK